MAASQGQVLTGAHLPNIFLVDDAYPWVCRHKIYSLHIIIHAQDLSALIILYKRRCHFGEIIGFTHGANLSLERACMGIVTQLSNLNNYVILVFR